MAKKDNSPAISLFAFQDIITSLTGILFLIVLLLVIFMLEMRPKEEENNLRAKIDIPAVKAQIAKLKSDLDELKKQETLIQEAIQDYQALDLETISDRIDSVKKEIVQKIQQVDNQKINIESKVEYNKELLEQIKRLHEKLVLAKSSSENFKNSLKKLQAEKLDYLEKIRVAKNAVKISFENTSNLTPILVECSANGIKVLDYKTNKIFNLELPNGDLESRKKAFYDWLTTRNSSLEYYTIIIKPESFEYAEVINNLGNLNLKRGLEFLPQNDISIVVEAK